jgi:hypothetical protein
VIQFLYQGGHGSHGPRAQALASFTSNSSCADVTSAPRTAAGLDTLAFWGHGDQYRLCGKTPQELFALIKEWKRLNPGLNTIELITCNARHTASGDSFANSLKAQFGILSGTSGMVVKALPVTVTGKMNAWSILHAETVHNSWCYVTAPGATDALLMEASALVIFERNATGGLVSYRGDIAARADQVVRAHPTREWTMNYGYFNTLRSHLGVVR